jgi:hypothetical protein
MNMVLSGLLYLRSQFDPAILFLRNCPEDKLLYMTMHMHKSLHFKIVCSYKLLEKTKCAEMAEWSSPNASMPGSPPITVMERTPAYAVR